MEDYYCHSCSVKCGFLNPGSVDHFNFTGSTYLLDKFVKHTIPPKSGNLVTIFSDPSYEAYKNYTINTMASGSTMIDQMGRKNIIWYASKDIGLTFLNGVPHTGSTDVVKVVLSDDSTKIHTFPTTSENIITGTCKTCGTNVLTGTTGSNK